MLVLSSTIQTLNMHNMKCIGLTQHRSEALRKTTIPGIYNISDVAMFHDTAERQIQTVKNSPFSHANYTK